MTTLISSIPDTVLEVYAREAILQAMPLLVFRNFVEVKSQLGDEPGEKINFLKLDNIPKGGRLGSETTPIPKNAMSESQVSFEVYEYGNAIQISRRALTASFRDLMSDASVLLGRDYATVLDEVLRDIFLTTANKLYVEGHTATNQITSTDYLSTKAIKDAVEKMKLLNIPPLVRGGDQHYLCILHPHQARKIRDDQDWLKPHQYVDTTQIYNGEVGKYEGVVFIETTQMPILENAGAGGTVEVYRAIMIGDRAVGFSETEPFQLVNDGIEDFGRLLSLGWYSIFGGGIINDHLLEIQTA